MSLLAVIGGSGFQGLRGLEVVGARSRETPFGQASGPLVEGRLAGQTVLFLARHGEGHWLPPHLVNYRANLYALHSAGARRVLGLAAVGGITADFAPRTFAVPDQIVDYTYGREHSFHDGVTFPVQHVDFTQPYCPDLRGALLAAFQGLGIPVVDRATYGATQGPRLETAAEIARMERDGCHLVGMTAMPEAALARELGLSYASLAFVVNWAAGKADGAITMAEINGNLDHCREQVEQVITALAGTA